jgi:hypothetical protein
MTPLSGERARHLIYALLGLGTAVGLLVHVRQPIEVTPPTRSLRDSIHALPRDKLVILSIGWDVGTRGENGPQTASLIEDFFRSDIKFAIFSWLSPPGPTMAEQIADRLAGKYHKRYGVDWVNWGYRTGSAFMLMGLAKNIPGIVPEDFYHTPISEIPVMRGIRDVHDISMVIEITGGASLDPWVQFWQGVYGTKLGYAPTGVMVPEAFPYLRAKQITGLQKGLVGAAEYERLVGVRGEATLRMPALSYDHVLVIALILVGNWLALRAGRRRREPEGQAPP